MEELNFYCKYLLLNNKQVTEDFLKRIEDHTEQVIAINDSLHKITFTKNDISVRIYIEYGTALPRPDHVINIETNENEENPRNPNQIEPKQMFALIELHNSRIWISNIKKTKIFEKIFDLYGFEAELKNIYKIDEFIDKLESVNGIRLSTTPENLFKLNELNQVLEHDIYGYGASSASLELKYKKNRSLQGTLKNRIKDLFDNRCSFNSFIISGQGDGHMDIVFNNESMVQKIYLNISPDETGEYDINEVFNELEEVLNINQ